MPETHDAARAAPIPEPRPSTDDNRLFAELVMQGYTDLRRLPTGEIAGLYQMVMTTGLFVGLTECFYRLRYCFEHQKDARAALARWDGTDDPGGPWIKAKGWGLDYRLRDDLGPGARR